MKKQKIAFLLSLSWLIGLIAFFSFPPAIKTASDHHHKSELSEISAPDLVLRTSGPSPEVLSRKILTSDRTEIVIHVLRPDIARLPLGVFITK